MQNKLNDTTKPKVSSEQNANRSRTSRKLFGVKPLLVALLVIALVAGSAIVITKTGADPMPSFVTKVAIEQNGTQGRLDFAVDMINPDKYSVEIVNLHGKVVRTKHLDSDVRTFSVDNLYPSVYTVTVSMNGNSGHFSKTAKLDLSIKEKNSDYANKFIDLDALKQDRIDSIRWLYRHGITVGSGSPETYKPGDVVNRGSMAQFLRKLAGPIGTDNDVPRIADIANLNEDRKEDIRWLAAEGITVFDRRFNPQNPVNRGAMAEFMYKLAGQPDTNLTHADYEEVKDIVQLSAERETAIVWLVKNHISVLDDGKFNPQNPVNRGSMAQFMQKLYDNVMFPREAQMDTESYTYSRVEPVPGMWQNS
jgi:hypothetical protein